MDDFYFCMNSTCTSSDKLLCTCTMYMCSSAKSHYANCLSITKIFCLYHVLLSVIKLHVHVNGVSLYFAMVFLFLIVLVKM